MLLDKGHKMSKDSVVNDVEPLICFSCSGILCHETIRKTLIELSQGSLEEKVAILQLGAYQSFTTLMDNYILKF